MRELEYNILKMRSKSLDRDDDDRQKLDTLGMMEWDLIAVVRDPEDKLGLIGLFGRSIKPQPPSTNHGLRTTNH